MNASQAYNECERLFDECGKLFARAVKSADAREAKALESHYREKLSQFREMRVCLALLIEREAATLQ